MEPSRLRLIERAIFFAMLAAPAVAAAGFFLSVGPIGGYEKAGTLIAAFGILLAAGTIAASYPLPEFRTILRTSRGGTSYEQLRSNTTLKASAILLSFIWIFALAGVLVGFAGRLGVFSIGGAPRLPGRLAALGTLVALVNLTHVHYLSLRTALPRQRTFPVTPFLLLSLAVTALLSLLAVALTERSFRLGARVEFVQTDAPMFLLGATILVCIDLVIARNVPNLLTVLREQRAPPSARDYVSKTKSILLPAVIAFALLFLIMLLLLVVGVGTTGLRSPILAGAFVLVGLALVVSVFFSMRLARTEDVFELYRLRVARAVRTGRVILYTSLGVAGVFALVSLYLLRGGEIWVIGSSRWVDVLSIGFLITFGPYGFYIAGRLRRIRQLEERFPDFLRDVAASHRGGLTLVASVQVAAKGEYGVLTPEIQKMADQLSWNVPFEEALRQMMGRVRTPLVERAITLINEASRSGGSTTDVLLAASHDAREIKNLETERRTTMGLYAAIIYITFGVFLVVAAVLYGQLVPEIIRAAEATSGTDRVGVPGLTLNVPTREEFRGFYFLAAVMQGTGNGLLAGMFQTGRFLSGMRHAFVMVAIAYVTFTFVFP